MAGSSVRGALASLTIAIPRGILLKVAGWAMVAHVAFTEPWYLGGIFGLFLIGASTTKDFADIVKQSQLVVDTRNATKGIDAANIVRC